MNRKVRVGRYTAAALIIAVGVLLILDKRWGTDYVYEMVDWWPFLLVVLGVEYIVLFLWTRRRKRCNRITRAILMSKSKYVSDPMPKAF